VRYATAKAESSVEGAWLGFALSLHLERVQMPSP